jgi:hypothetical protein
MERVGFGLSRMAWREEVNFGLTGIAWNGGSWFLPDWNGLEWRKSVLACLEWHGGRKSVLA